MDKAALILFALGAAAVYFGAQYMWGRYYSRPRSFRYGEEVVIWVPDGESEGASFFRRHYEHGSSKMGTARP